MAFINNASRFTSISRLGEAPKLCSVWRHSREYRPAFVPMMGRRSAKIANRKNKQTQIRTKIFARIGKKITMAVKAGGPDATVNRALAEALDAARIANVPKETTAKAIQRASNPNQDDFRESSFEIYGHGGCAIYVDVLSDNMNRAAAEIRTVVSRNQMKIASPGSVAYNFDRMGVIMINSESVRDFDTLFEAAIECGAEECEPDDEGQLYRIVTAQGDLSTARTALASNGYKVESAGLEMVAKATVEPSEEDTELNIKAIELLEELDDVDGVYSNMT